MLCHDLREKSYVSLIKNLAQAYQDGMQAVYTKPPLQLEVALFDAVIAETNKAFNNGPVTTHGARVQMSAVRIHGNMASGVTFKRFGKQTPKELGDTIFISLATHNCKTILERVSITQFKCSDKNTTSPSHWDIDSDQLYLLSRFPRFVWQNGLLKNQRFDLLDSSGSLGTYGLFHWPGDFIMLPARDIYSAVGPYSTTQISTSLDINEIRQLLRNRGVNTHPNFFCDPFITRIALWDILAAGVDPAISNCCRHSNGHEFVDAYLRFQFGELVTTPWGVVNPSVKEFVQKFMTAIRDYSGKGKYSQAKPIAEMYLSFDGNNNDIGSNFGDNILDDDGPGTSIVLLVVSTGE